MARGALKTKTKSIYGVHPGVAMVQKAIEELAAKTGRNLDQWVKFIKKSGPRTEDERRERLKTKHGLGTNYAKWLPGGGELEPQSKRGWRRGGRVKGKPLIPTLPWEPPSGMSKRFLRAPGNPFGRLM